MAHRTPLFATGIFGLSTMLIAPGIAWAQMAPPIEWQRCVGGSYHDFAYALALTPNGNCILAGETWSSDGDAAGLPPYVYGNTQAFVALLVGENNIQKKKAIGDAEEDRAWAVQMTTDGGVIMAGEITEVDPSTGWRNALVVKFRPSGAVQWQRSLGGSLDDKAYEIRQTPDGGYILAGSTSSIDGDVSGHHGGGDAWVVKLTASGTIDWQRCLGGTGGEIAYAISPTTDGGYILAGGTVASNNGDVSGNHNLGYFDMWVVKLDAFGAIQWQRCLGGSNSEQAKAVAQTSDGGYVVAGYAASGNGDVTGHHGALGSEDAWVVKLDAIGTLEWEHALGGSKWDSANDLVPTGDGGYIMAGFTKSNDGDVSGRHGDGYTWDAWLVKLDAAGAVQWQQCLGGTDWDQAYAVLQTADGGYLMAGETSSNDGDVVGNHGYATKDAWIVKLGPDGLPGQQLAPSSPYMAPPINGSTDPHGLLGTVDGFALFPNPTPGVAWVQWSLPGAALVQVMDATGRVVQVHQPNGSGQVLDLVGEKGGMYLVNVLFPDGTQAAKRLVKE